MTRRKTKIQTFLEYVTQFELALRIFSFVILLNFFQVINIDQDGNDHLPGRIEVTSEYLILHQGKKQCIQWPIRTLRRYGFEFNIFSFEAGRRCPTGEGIFAFRCVRAEQLFRLLQANIQVNRLNYNLFLWTETR